MPDQEYPPQDYFPSWKCKLIIRFDEFSNTKPITDKVPKKPAKNAKGVADIRASLAYAADPDAPPGVHRFLLSPKGVSKIGSPQDEGHSADNLTHVIAGIIPKEAEWTQNGIRTADTLRMTLKYIDMPIDPRTVRSCGVLFYLGTVSADQYAAGIRGERGDDQFASNLIPDTWIDDNGRQRSNLRFSGWVDKWEVEFVDGEPVINLECRDNTQLLIDTEVPPKLLLDVTKPIDEAIAQYLTHFPAFAGLTVEYRPGDLTDPIPTLGGALAKTAYLPKIQGLPPGKGGGAAQAGSKLSVWDFLTDAVGAVGHIIRIEGSNVIVQRARALYTSKFSGRADDPFQGRNGNRYRQFIYGRNVLEMRLVRNFSKQQATNVEVRCYDPTKKTMIVGRFPTTKDDFVALGLPGDGGHDQKWIVHSVPYVTSKPVLEIVAREIYEQVGRNELGVQITTKNMASFGGGNVDPDILDMQPGDAFEILTRREDDDVEYSTVNNIEASLVLQTKAASFMRELGFPAPFADAYAKAYSDSGFQTVYRAKQIGITCTIDDGVSLEVQGVNYIEVRADKAGISDVNIKETF